MRHSIPGLTLAVLCAAGPAPAQGTAGAELEALGLKGEGRYQESFRKTTGLLESLFQAAELAPEQAARAEFLLALADNLARKLPDHAGFVTLLEGIRDRPSTRRRPVLRGWVDRYLAEHLLLAGRAADAAAIVDGLGFLRDYQVIGPLDNERGSGFRRRFPPERAPGEPLDLEAPLKGKKREVTYRRVQLLDVPLALLDLGARLRPNRQVLAYAVFTVATESARDACLRLGSSGSVVVHANGREVLRRDCERRPIGWDQDACSFRLRPGRNLVVVKICAQAGGFGARLRLTAPDGSALPASVTVSAAPDDVAEAGRRQPAPTSDRTAPVKLGAVDWFTKQLSALEGQPDLAGEEARRLGMHAFRLAFLRALRAEDDDSSRRDRKWAKVAAKLVSDLGAAHYLLGFTLIRRGGSIADRDENARLQAYVEATRAWPRCAEAMRGLAEIERVARGNLKKAESWIQKSLAVNPSFVYAADEWVSCLDGRQFEAAKEKTVMDYLRDPKLGHHPMILRRAIDLLQSKSNVDEMLRLQRKLVELEYSPTALANLSRLLMRKGEVEEATVVAKRAARDFPQSRATHSLRAGLARSVGDLAGAMRLWNEWLEVCPEDERAWLALANLAARLGKKQLQIEHLERAIALNPNLKDERRHLEYLKAGAETFYSGFEIDAQAALAADGGPDPDAKEKGDSHYYVFRQELVRAYRDGTTSRYEHFLVRVLNEEGVNEFDVYRPPFYFGDQTARILEAKVIRPDGREERARLGRGGWVDLPPIRPGDAVEVAARVDDRSRSFFGDYFGHSFLFAAAEPVPVRRARLDLILEPGRDYHFQHVGQIPVPEVAKLHDGSTHRRYEMTGIPRRETEERAPSRLEVGPLVRVSTYRDWNAFASWWWNLIRKQTVATPELSERVRELTSGAMTLHEKVQRIYEFVVTQIRYKAWEFGVHGYKPYSVGTILARRHGDCKDKAILMNAMLAEIGVRAYPVLIRAEDRRERDELTLPMIEHFNHCITYIPPQRDLPGRFVDGTAQYHPIDTLPSMDRGAKVLTVLATDGKVMQIPWTTPQENRNEIRYEVQILETGDAIVEMTHLPHLNFAPPVRERFGNQTGKRRQRLADRLGRTFGDVEILDMQFSDLDDLGQPVRYSVKFRVKDFTIREGNGMRVKAAFRPENLTRMTPAERRTHDMLLRTPSSRDVTILYRAPDGFDWRDVPQPVSHDSKVGSFRLTVERNEKSVTLRRVRSFKTQRVEKADYGSFKQLAEAVDRAEAQQLLLRRSQ